MVGAVIYEDTRQQAGKHKAKHYWFETHGITLVRKKLDFGDYMTDGSNKSIDTKRSMAEVCGNCTREHDRFAREMERASENGYRLVILTEAGGQYENIGDVCKWTNNYCKACQYKRSKECNPRDLRGRCLKHKRKPIQGPQLARIMATMEEHYGVRFEFCHPMHSAKKICDILGVTYERDAESCTQAPLDGLQDAPDTAGD